MVARLRRDRAVPFALAVALLVSAGPRAQQPAPAGTGVAQQPVFRGGANFVLVDAYPQKDGKIVEGLTATDFQILEDGKPQAIEGLEFVRVEPNQPESTRRDPNNLNEMKQQASDPHNRVFVVFLDAGHITTTGSHDIRRPLVDTLDRIVGPTDLFGVATANQRARDLTLGRRLLSVEEQLSKYWYWGAKDRITGDMSDPGEADITGCFHQKLIMTPAGPTFVPWMVDLGPRRRYMDDILIERRREDRALQALRDLTVYLPTIREARTVLLVVSNGWILFRPEPYLQNELGTDLRMKDLQVVPGANPVGTAGTPTRFGNINAKASTVEWSSCVTELNRLALLEDQSRFRDLLDLAARSNVSFYPIAADGLAPFDIGSASDNSAMNPNARPGETILGENFNRLADRGSSLRTAAENTDGIAVVDTNDLAKGLRRIIDDVSAYYLLGYYSTNAKFDGKYRRIEVKMTKPGVAVHARRGYIAPLPAPASGPAPPAAALNVESALGLLARLTGSTEVSVVGAANAAGVAAVVELPDRALVDPAWSRGADVTVDLTDEGGARLGSATGRVEAGTRSVLVQLPKTEAKGAMHLGARARSGTSSLDGRGDVLTAASALVGAPVLYRATPSPRSPLRPVADFLYRRNERLHVEWPVLQPLDQRVARVLDRRGQALALAATLTEREVDGAPAIAVDLNLAPLAEGDYVLDLEIGRGPTKEHALMAFRVVR